MSEWCQDWYDYYPGGSLVDPKGPATGSAKVFRGGSFADSAPMTIVYLRPAGRRYISPNTSDSSFGFRVVLAPVP